MIILSGVADKAKQKAEQDNKLANEDWKNTEQYSEGCRVVYGVEGGKFFAYGEQDDLEEIKWYCRQKRMEEAANPKAFHWLGVQKWVMPKILELELMSRGFPIEQMIASGDLKELDKLFDTEFKEFKLTNLMLTGVNQRKRATGGVKGI